MLDCAEELLFVHLVAALLPRVAKALQNGADLLARRDAHLPQVVPADGETRDGPARHLGKKLLLALVLEQLTHFGLDVHLPALQIRTSFIITALTEMNSEQILACTLYKTVYVSKGKSQHQS